MVRLFSVPGTVGPVTTIRRIHTCRTAGQAADLRIGDVSNPNLKPWVRKRMKKEMTSPRRKPPSRTIELSAPRSSRFYAYGGGDEPIYFVQTPKMVWMIYQGNQEVRRIYLDVSHSKIRSALVRRIGRHYERPRRHRHDCSEHRTFLDFYVRRTRQAPCRRALGG